MLLKNKQKRLVAFILIGWLISVIIGITFVTSSADVRAQIPTGSIPTVTGTPFGAIAVVLDNEQGYVNVRGGPSTVAYDIVGILVEGAQVPAIGRSPGSDWVQVAYPGVPGNVAWVYTDLVSVTGSLPVIEPPPTKTPMITVTIDPTLAAQFLVDVPPTRLPTFTAPPELVQPTLPSDAPIATQGRIPMGLLIIGMAVIGIFGLFISLLSRG